MFINSLHDYDLFDELKEVFNHRRPNFKKGDLVEFEVCRMDFLSTVRIYEKNRMGVTYSDRIQMWIENSYRSMRKGQICAQVEGISWKFYSGNRVEFFYTVIFRFDNCDETFLVDRISEQILNLTSKDPYSNQFIPSPRLVATTHRYEDGTMEEITFSKTAIDATKEAFGL